MPPVWGKKWGGGGGGWRALQQTIRMESGSTKRMDNEKMESMAFRLSGYVSRRNCN